MPKEQEVIFRRIRGRIIPIKVNKRHGNVKKQIKRSPKKTKKRGFSIAGSIAGGALASLFGGSAFAEFGTEAQRARDVSKAAFKQAQRIKVNPRAFEGQAKGLFRQAAFQRKRSASLFKQRNIVAGGALGAGAFLFARGIRELAESKKGERLTLSQEAAADLAATAAITLGSIEAGAKLRIPKKKAASLLLKIFRKGR